MGNGCLSQVTEAFNRQAHIRCKTRNAEKRLMDFSHLIETVHLNTLVYAHYCCRMTLKEKPRLENGPHLAKLTWSGITIAD